MQIPLASAAVAVGIAGTWLGAELLVRGASLLALRLGVRPMVVGMTVVAFGTSAPEAVASLTAALSHSGGLALGNVLGSNVANIGLILGLLGLIRPIYVPWAELRRDVILVLVVTVVATGLLYRDRQAGWPEGLILLAGLALFLRYYILTGRSRVEIAGPVDVPPPVRLSRPVLQSLGGLALLVGGASLLVEGARHLALELGISEDVIGATLVAVGTSLPELAASVVAVVRGEHEIGVGNILGSNALNLLFVLGITSTVAGFAREPLPVGPETATLFLPAMLLFTFGVVPILRRHGRVERPESALLLALYLGFSFVAYYQN